MMRLAGRRAFITGAGRGIGRCIATRMAEHGAQVAVADIDAFLRQTEDGGVGFFPTHLSSYCSRSAAVSVICDH